MGRFTRRFLDLCRQTFWFFQKESLVLENFRVSGSSVSFSADEPLSVFALELLCGFFCVARSHVTRNEHP